MTVLEYTGKTVNEALAKALNDLRLRKDDVDITVLSEGSKGFLGIGAKDACIRVRRKDGKDFSTREEMPSEKPQAPVATPPTKAPEAAKASTPAEDNTDISVIELAEETTEEEKTRPVSDLEPAVESAEDIGMAYLAPIFNQLKVSPVVQYSETAEEIRFDIQGEDVGILIGRRGETLNALQFLLSLAINRRLQAHKRIILDCENYRSRRADTLDHLALRMAKKAKDTGRRVSLEPMSAAERRLVHLALEGVSGIKVESIGEDPNRRIVIYPNHR